MRSLRTLSVRSGLRSNARPRHVGHIGIFRSPSRPFSFHVPRRQEEKKYSTPLAQRLTEAINTTGPVPLASYMRMCLTSDLGGYYTGAIEKDRDQFGQKGDFITSPEISQIFGELIGIWFVAEWMSQGRPKTGVEIIEVGPGRGTLMDDILRTIRNFPQMASSIDRVCMVEASSELRTTQKNLLCGEDAAMTESKVGWHSTCKYSSLPIVWTDAIKAIPMDPNKTPFIVAHEFFDALPIHAFQLVDVPPKPPPSNQDPPTIKAPAARNSETGLQWREMVVSPTPTPLTTNNSPSPSSLTPEFQLTLAPYATHHSRYLPETSSRYRALKSRPNLDALIEVCPDASMYAADFASRIGGSKQFPKAKPSGAALILDYGTTDTIPVNSLRGIRHHQRVSPFSEPGLVDLSVDVDFTAVAEHAMTASEGVEVHGPVDQGFFLESMGIRQRAEVLSRAVADETKKKDIEKAWKRLIDRGPDGMGKLYKALAILPENEGARRPVGFGGDIAA